MEFLKAMKVRLKELQSGTPPKGKWSTVGSVERKALSAALKAGLLTVGKEVGSGGQGHVFVATHSGKEYALKQSSFAEGSRQERIAQADLEFGTSLQHDCLQEYLAWAIQEAGVHPSKGKKLLMLKTVQLLAETDLHDALDKGSFHSPDGLPKLGKLLTVFHEVARGVAYLHGQRVVHCDLKHSNVLLSGCDTNTPAARVCDFGLCVRIQSTEQEWCLGRHGRGTHGYIAPEIYPGVVMKDGRCMSLIALRSDVYSMGIMLWEALTLCAAASHSESVSKDTPRVPTTVHPNFPRLACFPPLEQFVVSQHGSQILLALEKLISGMCHADWQQRPDAISVVATLANLVCQVDKHGIVSASRGHLSSSHAAHGLSTLNPKRGMLGGKHKHKAGGNHKLKPDGKTDGKRGKDSGTESRKSNHKSSKKNKGGVAASPSPAKAVAVPDALSPASPGIHAVHAPSPVQNIVQAPFGSMHVPCKNTPARTLDVDCVARLSTPQPNDTDVTTSLALRTTYEQSRAKDIAPSCLSRAMCTKPEPTPYSPPAISTPGVALFGRLAPAADPPWLATNEPTCTAAAKQVAASNSAAAAHERKYGFSSAAGQEYPYGSSNFANQEHKYNRDAANKMPLMKAVQDQLDEAMSSLATFRRQSTGKGAPDALSTNPPSYAHTPEPLIASQPLTAHHLSRSSERGSAYNTLSGVPNQNLPAPQTSKYSPTTSASNPLHSGCDVNGIITPGLTKSRLPALTSDPQQQSKARPGGILARWHQMMEERGILNPSPTPQQSRTSVMDLPMSQLFSINFGDASSTPASPPLPTRQDACSSPNPTFGNHAENNSPQTPSSRDRNTAASTSGEPDATPSKSTLSSSILDAINSIGKPPMHPPVLPNVLRTGESVATVAAAQMDMMRSSQESLSAMNAVCRRLAEREDVAVTGHDAATDYAAVLANNGMWPQGPSGLSIRRSSSTFELQPGAGVSYQNRVLSSAGSQLLSLDRSLLQEQVRWDSPAPTPLARGGMSTCSSMFDLDGVVGFNFESQPIHTAPVLETHMSDTQFTLRSSVLHSLREARSEPNMLSPRSIRNGNHAFSPGAGTPFGLSTRDTNLVDTVDLPYPPLPDIDSLSSCATIQSDFEVSCGSISDIRPALFYQLPNNPAGQATAVCTAAAAASASAESNLVFSAEPVSHAVSHSNTAGVSDSPCDSGSANASESKLSVADSKFSMADSKFSMADSMLSIDTATIPGRLLTMDYHLSTDIKGAANGAGDDDVGPVAEEGEPGCSPPLVRAGDSSSSITSPLPKLGSPFLHSANMSDGAISPFGPQNGHGVHPTAAALPSLPSLSS